MWPTTSLTDLLGIDHPILLAPMAGSGTTALAAAVSNAGGLGALGCAFHDADRLRGDMLELSGATNRPYNLNFFVHAPPRNNRVRAQHARELMAKHYQRMGLNKMPDAVATHAPFGVELLEVLMASPPAVVSFHFGLPAEASVIRLKDAGVRILSSATCVREAIELQARGVDAVIAQGWEAGGHRGTFLSSFDGASIGTMALVPQVVDAVDVPVIAAGGIADGRGIAAALCLGASGVQIGTAFLTSEESGAPPVHRRALLDASDDDTRLTRTFSGRPARGLANRYIEEMMLHEHNLPDFPIMNTLTGPLRKASAERNLPDYVALWSGQAVRLNRSVSAGTLMTTLVAETSSALARSTQSVDE